eukprot:GFUD01024385.1.p1 GENE.GFUD01024385.1~~GFUD01024385.1.p1  ORF type:complete len:192 (+),score=52.16 GFUD01024385.1:60-635(+)
MGISNGKLVLTDEIVEDISRTSGMEKKVVKQQCQNFLSKHPTGQMDKTEFRKFIKMALPNLNMKKMEKNMFRMYDTNQDGIISMDEFLVVFQILSGGTPEENLKRIFRVFDADSDGLISKAELKKLVKDMHAVIKENNPEKYQDDLITDSTWLEMDKDRDGFITCEEFTAAVLAKDKFSKFLTVHVIDMFS